LAASDPLTGILNRRGFEQAAQPLADACQQNGRPLAVVIADIDRFKTVNDRFGHSVGDAVLQRFVAHVQAFVRDEDLFGRLGGEEFVLLLPNMSGGEAIALMERVREGVADAAAGLLPQGGITASFGIAVMEGAKGTLRDTMKCADKALYCSKVGGRDRVTLSSAADMIAAQAADESWALETLRRAAG
ncbi:MAG TPA: GGDEF domain-containing protein, partial [Reyranella sp.]|nr:GGDEF domain-containing protein [Reyranella sp.]